MICQFVERTNALTLKILVFLFFLFCRVQKEITYSMNREECFRESYIMSSDFPKTKTSFLYWVGLTVFRINL